MERKSEGEEKENRREKRIKGKEEEITRCENVTRDE